MVLDYIAFECTVHIKKIKQMHMSSIINHLFCYTLLSNILHTTVVVSQATITFYWCPRQKYCSTRLDDT